MAIPRARRQQQRPNYVEYLRMSQNRMQPGAEIGIGNLFYFPDGRPSSRSVNDGPALYALKHVARAVVLDTSPDAESFTILLTEKRNQKFGCLVAATAAELCLTPGDDDLWDPRHPALLLPDRDEIALHDFPTPGQAERWDPLINPPSPGERFDPQVEYLRAQVANVLQELPQINLDEVFRQPV